GLDVRARPIERTRGRDRRDRGDPRLREQAQDLSGERAAAGRVLPRLGGSGVVVPADLTTIAEWSGGRSRRRARRLGARVPLLLAAVAADSTERAATLGLAFGHAVRRLVARRLASEQHANDRPRGVPVAPKSR